MANILTCNSIREFIKLKSKFGFIETLICSYAILTPYGIGIFRLDMILPIFLGYLAITERQHRLLVNYTPFLLLFAYTILHEIILCFILDEIPSYHINSTFILALILIPTFVVTKAIDFDKLVNALFVISFIVVLGVFYHIVIIKSGGEVEPIRIPFMPFTDDGTRLTELSGRPKSFFLEPSNVNSYLMFPLFLSLYYRKIRISLFLILGILLTTSTNGLVTTSVMIFTYLLTQKVGWKIWLSMLILIPLFVILYLSSDVFEQGRAKAENTNVEENVRTINGPMLVLGMPNEHLIFGFPSPNVNDYKKKTNFINGVTLFVDENDSAFVSAFWMILAKFGLVGMLIFLYAHYKLYWQCKGLIFFFIPSFILLFVGGNVSMNESLFEWTVLILSFASYEKKRAVESDMTLVNANKICKA